MDATAEDVVMVAVPDDEVVVGTECSAMFWVGDFGREGGLRRGDYRLSFLSERAVA